MIYLASASPRRRELLQQINIRFEQIHAEIDESPLVGESPPDYVRRLALQKTRAGRRNIAPGMPLRPVLGADTAVVIEDRIYGKPADENEARTILEQLSGRTHQVMSAVAVLAKNEETALSTSLVTFASLNPAQINAYIATGEPFGKAGAYAIQGYAAGFIHYLEGSYSGVMGLPLYETAALLKRAGVPFMTAGS